MESNAPSRNISWTTNSYFTLGTNLYFVRLSFLSLSHITSVSITFVVRYLKTNWCCSYNTKELEKWRVVFQFLQHYTAYNDLLVLLVACAFFQKQKICCVALGSFLRYIFIQKKLISETQKSCQGISCYWRFSARDSSNLWQLLTY